MSYLTQRQNNVIEYFESSPFRSENFLIFIAFGHGKGGGGLKGNNFDDGNKLSNSSLSLGMDTCRLILICVSCININETN